MLDPYDTSWIQMVREKIQVQGNDAIDVSARWLSVLRNQLQPLLKPVLRIKEFEAFDLNRAFTVVADVAAKVACPQL